MFCVSVDILAPTHIPLWDAHQHAGSIKIVLPLLPHPLYQGFSEASNGWCTSRQAGEVAMTNSVDTVHDSRRVAHNALTCGSSHYIGVMLEGIYRFHTAVEKHGSTVQHSAATPPVLEAPVTPPSRGLRAVSPLIAASRWGSTVRTGTSTTLLPSIPWTRHRQL